MWTTLPDRLHSFWHDADEGAWFNASNSQLGMEQERVAHFPYPASQLSSKPLLHPPCAVAPTAAHRCAQDDERAPHTTRQATCTVRLGSHLHSSLRPALEYMRNSRTCMAHSN